MKIPLLALFMMLLISACQSTGPRLALDTVALSGDLVTLNSRFRSMEQAIDLQHAVLDERQRDAVRMLVTRLNGLRRAVYMLIDQRDDGAQTLVNADQLRHLYRSARGAYVETRELIQPDLDRLPPALRADLQALDTASRRLDGDLQRLLANGGDVTATVSRIIALAGSAARLSELTLDR